MSRPPPSRAEAWFLSGVFGCALIFHCVAVTFNWTVPFMPGFEFRQTQTALITRYIDQNDNFSLLYETPLVGKPWVSILLEVPVYQWSVVGLSRATGLPHVPAARIVSITCFYLMLPALWLLLGRLALPRPRRLLVLALVLTCPVYIFYSRAFLIEAMELMACAWFLLGFVRTMDERRGGWLVMTMVAGTAAALIKSSTLAVWLLPAAVYGAWQLRRDLQARRGAKAVLGTLGWGFATVVIPLGALRGWLSLTDPIKAAHASAWLFTSHNLSVGNWGLFDLAARFSPVVWKKLLAGWTSTLLPAWLCGGLLLTGLLVPGRRWWVLGLAGVFFFPQLLFPFAYADQDYYFYACAVFLHAAIGFSLIALLDSRAPRWVVAGVLLVPLLAQGWTYWRIYQPQQALVSEGGFPYTSILRDVTPASSVIIVGGMDWAAIIPYYAQRKALMIRNGLEHDPAYLDRAFADLEGEDVSALVLVGPVREHRGLIERAAARFGLNPAAPTFRHESADIYVPPRYRAAVELRVRSYAALTLPEGAAAAPPPAADGLRQISAEEQGGFSNISPRPFQMRFEFGLSWLEREGRSLLLAHPESDLWLQPPAQATRIFWSFGIMPAAYEKPEAQTDGVEFIVQAEGPGGESRPVFRRRLDPAKNPQDRGDQRVEIPYQPRPGEQLRFATRPGGHPAFDWAYWERIEVR